MNLSWQAFGYGALSASSLVLGALVALVWKPLDRVVAAIMAFGAGVLLSALAFELVDEAVRSAGFAPMAIGAAAGGVLFVGLNRVLDARGAFLRKVSTTKRVLRERKRERAASLIERLSRVEILRSLPPEEIQALVGEVDPHHALAGTVLFRKGDVGDALYMIEEGQVDIVGGDRADRLIATLGPGDSFGEMALLTGDPRSAGAVARTDVRLLAVNKESFDRLLKGSPKLALAVGQLLARRLGSSAERAPEASADDLRRWQKAALKNVGVESLSPSALEVRTSAAVFGGAPMALWLGILLDGVPESLVIGAGVQPGQTVGLAFLAGVFLSNFPEALSSAAGMRRCGFSPARIFAMWAPLVLLAGLVATFGHLFCADVTPWTVAVFQGAAAGAMLTMVAETMLPEAYEQGGSVVGLATLAGFLVAFFVKDLAH